MAEDAFGNHIPDAVVVGSVAPLHPHDTSATAAPRSINDDGKSTEALFNEFERVKADLDRYPEAAKKLNLAGFDPKNPVSVIAARDDALKLLTIEQEKEIKDKLTAGIAALVGAGALAAGVISPEQVENNKLPINKEFEKLLAGLGAGDKQAFSLITGGNDVKNLDSLKPNDGLPSLAAALEQTKSASAGRSITA